MILETVSVSSFEVNCYILAVASGCEAIIIDPGAEETKIRKALIRHNLRPAFIINTHGHFDHIGCDDKFGVPVYIHKEDLSLLKDPQRNLSSFMGTSLKISSNIRALEDKEGIELGQIKLEVIHTPGHTPGGICLWLRQPANKVLFTGDTLFCHGIGRTDFPGSDEKLLIKNIKEKLLNLDDATVIYPGHGSLSTIGEEKRNNPFLA